MLTRLTALPWLLAAWLLLAGTASAQVATYAPVGPQNNVPLATITGGGWTECHRETFSNNTPIATISAACNKAQMMMACTNDDNTIQLLAQAPKADVMFDTGSGNVGRQANGSAWYFNGSWSWGFAPGGATLNRNSCDGGDDPTFSVNPDPMRMCIHTGGNSTGGGWRCGSTTGNNGTAIYAYRRIFFHADGAVAGATAPASPTSASAVAGNTQATVSFVAPVSNGGSPITGYRVISSPGNVQATGASSPILVTGLVNGTSYTFTVVATNAVGDSLPSLPSNAVVPVGPPTLSNFNDISRTFGDADFALTPPTSDSAGAFSYTSSNPAVATISGNTVTIVGAGTSTITANQAADGGFTAGSTTATLTVAKAAPAITWLAPLSRTFGDPDFSLAAPTSSSPAAFTYASSNPAVASVSGNVVSITGAGSAVLTASQPEGANHLAGTVTVSITVATADPGLSGFNDLNRVFGEPAFALSPPASASAGAFTYTSSDPSVATVSGNTVTLVGAGVTTLTANQAADGNYAASSTTATLTVAKAAPAISWVASINRTFGDAAFALPVPTSNSTGVFTYSSSNPAVATVSGNTVTITGAGTATLFADQAADDNYVAGQASTTLTVSVADPGLSGFSDINKVFGDAAFALVAPTSASNGAFTYTSANPAVATISGNTVTIVGAGTSLITATQAADGNYAASSTTATLTVAQAAPVITWVASINRTFGDPAFALPAPSSNSTGAFTYSSSNPSVATVSGNTVTITGAGTATLFADQAADPNYLAGQASTALTVVVADPGLSGFADISKTFGDAAFALVAPTSASAGAFTYTSANPAVATISGNTVTITGAGSSVITATQAANGNYAGASITATLTVGQAAPAISWVASINRTFGAPAFALPVPTSNSSGAFTYASSNPAVATVSGNTVTIVSAGTATITASQAADANYVAGSATLALTVGKAAPSLAWIGDILKTYGEAAFDLANPTSPSPGAFTFTSANPAVATVSGRTVTITGSGTTVLTATQAETANYSAASVTTRLIVGARPDPTRDPGVVAGVQAQVDASVRFASAQQANIRDRLRQVRSGNNASSNALSLNLGNGFGPGLSLNAGQAMGGDALPLPEGWGWWTAGAITFGDRDARQGSSAFGFQSDGLSFGLDRRVGENAVLGVSLGKGFSDADFDADNSSLGGDYKSLSAYGLWRNDRLFVDGVLGAGRLDFDIRRYSALVNGYGLAQREGDQQFASLTVGHESQGESMRLATYGRFDASRTDLDAYRESGLGIYDLSYTDQRIDTRTVSLGAEGGSAWSTESGVVRPYWMLEYRMSVDDKSDVGINYVVLPNASDYLLRLRSYADDALVWGGGLDFDIGRRWGLALLYRGESVSGVGSSYSVGLQLSWKGGTPSAALSAGASESSDATAAVKGASSSRTR